MIFGDIFHRIDIHGFKKESSYELNAIVMRRGNENVAYLHAENGYVQLIEGSMLRAPVKSPVTDDHKFSCLTKAQAVNGRDLLMYFIFSYSICIKKKGSTCENNSLTFVMHSVVNKLARCQCCYFFALLVFYNPNIEILCTQFNGT